MMKKYLLILLSLLYTGTLNGQQLKSIKIKDPIICHAATENNPHFIPPPKEYLERLNNPNARTKSSNIAVTYIGFSAEAQQAFQRAVDIWEAIIVSSVPIRIEARWIPLGAGVLGSAIYTSAYANFTGAQKLNVFYPVAIAEKITGRELNNGEADLVANFNSNNPNWHYQDSEPEAGKYDLTTVVLHEIGHGLGFAGTFDVSGTQGEYGLVDSGIPIIYDVPIENGTNVNLIEGFTSPSTELRTQLIGNNIFFDTPTSGNPKLYAPASFNGGSSISHLDETTFNGTGDALMTPQIAPQERQLNPGVALNMLYDLGWRVLKINHNRLPSTENVVGPFTVVATIEAEANGFSTGTFKLNYTTNGTTFTAVDMLPTGQPNQYSANIPSQGVASSYGYYLSARDQSNTEFVNPGKFVRAKQTQLQNYFVFETGPDLKAPKILHTPKPFLLDTDTQLFIEAKITDNISINNAVVEYSINEVAQTPVPLVLITPEEDSIYTVTLNFASLTNGDKIEYKIIATDNAIAGPFQTVSPASGLYTVNVVGLSPTQNSYANNFNSPSDDFFGNGFTVTTPTGFTNGAIHTEHPYLEGNGFPGDKRELIYQLKIPIRVKAVDAYLKFDEVVLVEPGQTGVPFGEADFWDYVVVEGSTDGGFTWTPLANGYDSRDYSPWLTRYNSSIVGNNSTATGDASLYRTRTINLLNKFSEGNEVVIRFRLFSDQLANGWGWAIDNLEIQLPKFYHTHADYLLAGTDELSLNASILDKTGFEEFKIEYRINGGELSQFNFDLELLAIDYNFILTGTSALSENDLIEYRWYAKDDAGYEAKIPGSGFLKVPVINFQTPVTTYSNNFNAPSGDFVGNFFSQETPANFLNGAVHSSHPYPTGFGHSKTSNLTYTLKKPITINANNPFIRFDEVVLVEGHASNIVFGNPAFNDYVIIEGSKNNGQTWLPIADGYDILKRTEWISAFNSNASVTNALFFTHVLNLTQNGNFATGDNVILRFRLFSNETVNGWGWAIDNLYIQDPITSREKELETSITVYPNPTKNNIIIEASGLTSAPITIQVVSTQGQLLYNSQTQSMDGKLNHTIAAEILPKGLFFVKILTEGSQIIRKVKVD